MKAPNFGLNDTNGEQMLGELILYVAGKCSEDRMFGAIKLNKILWWSDFLAYAQYGRPITGVQYRRLGHGPAPRQFIPVRDALVAKQDAVVQRQRMLGRVYPRSSRAAPGAELRIVHGFANRSCQSGYQSAAAKVCNRGQSSVAREGVGNCERRRRHSVRSRVPV